MAMVQGSTRSSPVDVYVPGCPAPVRRAVVTAVLLLHKKIKGESLFDHVHAARTSRSTSAACDSPRADRRNLGAVRQLRPPVPLVVNPTSTPCERPSATRSAAARSCGDTIVYVAREALLDAMPGCAMHRAGLRLPGGRHGGRVPRPRAPLEVVYQLRFARPPADLRVKVELDPRGELTVDSVVPCGGAPIGWSARRTTCSHQLRAIPDLAPHPHVGDLRRSYPPAERISLRGRFSRGEQVRRRWGANPEAHYSMEELSIAEAYDELPADMKERLRRGERGKLPNSE